MVSNDSNDEQTVVTIDPDSFARMFREELEKIQKKQNDEKNLEGCQNG